MIRRLCARSTPAHGHQTPPFTKCWCFRRSATNDAGSIGDLFTSLGGSPPVLDSRYAEVKERVRPSQERLHEAWGRLQEAVALAVSEIKEQGSAVIPTVDFSALEANSGFFPSDVAAAVRQRGCVVVRNTVHAESALRMKGESRQYIASNRERLAGFPANDPQVWEVYWSKPQIEMRQHHRLLLVQTALNRLWHCRALHGSQGQVHVDVHRPVTYCDRLRIRLPGDTSFTLGPHVDGGSTERWEDPEYSNVYSDILSGNWEQYDPFDATHRAGAQYDMYRKNIGLCTAFRSFQGWVSLSNSGTGRGALTVIPALRESTAFLILRPFLDDVDASCFCGANPGLATDLFPQFHQALIHAMVAVPDVGPGDSVWWHCDLVHAVESVHGGTEDSSVYFIPAAMLCRKNATYLHKQARHFEERRTPPDFPPNDSEMECVGLGRPEDLSEAGRLAMGFEAWPDQQVAGEPAADFEASSVLREECRRIILSGR